MYQVVHLLNIFYVWLIESGRLKNFSNMYLTLKMFTTIPVTSCKYKRIFFKLSIVKINQEILCANID